MPYREIEHTADLGLEVSAPDLTELLRQACAGLFWLQYGDVPKSPVGEWRQMIITGSGYEMLLVEWLNEILYLCERDRVRVLDVEIDLLAKDRLNSRLRVASWPDPNRGIKAVTYSNLAFSRTSAGISVQLTLDV